MKRIIAVSFVCVGVLVAYAGIVLAAKAKDAPDATVIAECVAKQTPVKFNHKRHSRDRKIACDFCHHTDKSLTPDSAVEVKKCIVCHAKPGTRDMPGCSEGGMKKNVYHTKCIGCHVKNSKAPAMCKDCHRPN